MTSEPKIESMKDVLLAKGLQIFELAILSLVISFLLALLMSRRPIEESIIQFIAILGFIEVAFGAIFSLGVSEVAYASRAGLNPVYGETITRDRLRYHTTQILNGINLIFSGVILMLLGTLLS